MNSLNDGKLIVFKKRIDVGSNERVDVVEVNNVWLEGLNERVELRVELRVMEKMKSGSWELRRGDMAGRERDKFDLMVSLF